MDTDRPKCICVDQGERCWHDADGPDGLCFQCRSYDCVNALRRTMEQIDAWAYLNGVETGVITVRRGEADRGQG